MQNKILVSALAGIMAMANVGALPAAGAASVKKKYCGSDGFVNSTETISYSRKETETYKIKSEVPNYYNQIQNASCANVAGTILIGYYDRMCEELIPDFKAYVQLGSVIRYRMNTFETEDVMTELYSSMGTNIGGSGTTYNGFHKGMKSYVENRNYSYLTEDLGNLNFEKFKSVVESEKPVALFLDNYSFLMTYNDTGSSEELQCAFSSIPHVAIGYGYRIDTYYDANNNIIATRTYLNIASGIIGYGLTELCLDGKSVIDRANSILIR